MRKGREDQKAQGEEMDVNQQDGPRVCWEVLRTISLASRPPSPLYHCPSLSKMPPPLLTLSFPGPRRPFSVYLECVFAVPAGMVRLKDGSYCTPCHRAPGLFWEGARKVTHTRLHPVSAGGSRNKDMGKFIFVLEISEYLTLFLSLSKQHALSHNF